MAQLEKVSNWTKLDEISTWSSDLTVSLFSPTSEKSSAGFEEAWKGVEEYENQEEYHKAVVKWVEAFKSVSQYGHIHPLANLCQTPEVANTVSQWKRSTFDFLFASARTRFTPWEAYTILESTGMIENLGPIEKATFDLYREEYKSIRWSEQVPKEVEKYLIDLVYRYVCKD